MSHRKLYRIFVSKIWMLWIDLFRRILIFTAINPSFLCMQCEFIMRKAQSRASPALNEQNRNVCMNLYTSCEWRVTSRYEIKTGEREKNWEKVQVYCVPRIRIAHQLAWFVWQCVNKIELVVFYCQWDVEERMFFRNLFCTRIVRNWEEIKKTFIRQSSRTNFNL